MDPCVWMLALRLTGGVGPGGLRYQERVEVRGYRDPNEALQAYLEERDLTRGPSPGVPTTRDPDLQRHRPHTSPSADLTQLLGYLASKAVKGLGPDGPRYFVYQLSSGSDAIALMREAPIPLEASLAFPGILVRLLGEYQDRKEAVRAFRDAERAASRTH
jgi:hypothetical protein